MFFTKRIKSLDDNELQKSTAKFLKKMAKTNKHGFYDIPNMIFNGPRNSGKKTLIRNFIYQIHGEDSLIEKDVVKDIRTTETATVKMEIIQGKHHIIIDPSRKKKYDRQVMLHLIKTYASELTIKTLTSVKPRFIIILNSDKLSNGAQNALRVTLEKYTNRCKIILCTTDISKIINPIQSRCFPLLIGLPKQQIIYNMVNKTLIKTNLPYILSQYLEETDKNPIQIVLDYLDNKNNKFITKIKLNHIFNKSKSDIMKTLGLLYLDNDILPWQNKIRKSIINKLSNKDKLLDTQKVMHILNEILNHNISATEILKFIMDYYLNKMSDDKNIRKLLNNASRYQYQLKNSKKPVIHLCSFIIQLKI